MAKSRVDGEVLLVGSLPFNDAETAFSRSATKLGTLCACIPDGEYGQRRFYVAWIPMDIFANHPDMVELTRYQSGSPEDQPEENGEWRPGAAPEHRFTFKLKDGVEKIEIDLGYGGYAIDSYEKFKKLREEGVIPAEVKFQVSIPTTPSGVDWFIEPDDDRKIVRAGYRRAVEREIKQMLEVIPAEDLVIQLDFCNELLDIAIGDETYQPYFPKRTVEEKKTEYIEELRLLSDAVPAEVALGYHWCYGTWGGWPMVDMDNVGLCVEMTNRAVEAVSRQVDYVHIPVGETSAESFYAPLADLKVDGTKVYLGMVHFHEESDEEFTERVIAAKKFLPDFGIAAVCGYGREDPKQADELYELHTACAEILREQLAA